MPGASMNESTVGSPPAARVSAGVSVRPVTALFVDIVGSTALGERLGVEEVRALVAECTTRFVRAIERYGGTVGAQMGDGLAAFFGLEAAREDDMRRAALAALEVRSLAAAFAHEAREAWGVDDLCVRIGLNTGRVAVGPSGSDGRPAALGDAVNVAARLESLADPQTIVVGASFAEALGAQFEFRPLGTRTLKGRRAPVEAYVLVGRRPGPVRGSAEQPMVGRERELFALQEMLSDLQRGHGAIGLILGDAGIGKTKLLAEARAAAPATTMWLGAACLDAGTPPPYEVFADLLRAWLGVQDGQPEVAVRVRLRARLEAAFGAGAGELIAPLGGILGLTPEAGAPTLVGLPIDVQRAAVHGAYVKWLRGIARSSPLVIAVDDCGRMDAGSAELLTEVYALTDVVPILVLAAFRFDPAEPGWPLRTRALQDHAHRTSEFRLGALIDAQARRLIASIDRGATLTDADVADVIRRAEGSPLFVEELVQAIVSDAPVLFPALPAAIEGLLLSRIDALPDVAREVLQSAAILGREFNVGVLERMHGTAAVETAMVDLLRADVVRESRRSPVELTFKHGLLREAARSTLPRERILELHRRAADAIELCDDTEVRDRAAALAWHYVTSGSAGKAVSFLEDLGERYAAVSRYDEAVGLLSRCVAFLKEDGPSEAVIRVGGRLAELLAGSGRITEAVTLLDETVIPASSGRQLPTALVLKGRLLASAGEFEAAAAALEAALDTDAEAPTADRALTLLAQIALRRQELGSARGYLDRVEARAPLSFETRYELASAWAGYLAASGDFVAARGWGAEAVQVAGVLGRTASELKARRQLGLLEILNGDVRAGHAHLVDVATRCTDLGYAIGSIEAGVNLVHACFLLGELAEAERRCRDLLSLRPTPFWRAVILANLAAVLFELDGLDAAQACAVDVLALGVEVTSPAPRIGAYGVLAKVQMARGELDAAEATLDEAQQEATRLLGARSGLSVAVCCGRIELSFLRADANAAHSAAEVALELIDRVERPQRLSVRRLHALAVAERDPAASAEMLSGVIASAREMGLRLEEARALAALAKLRPGEARMLMDAAQTILDDLGARRACLELDELRERALGVTSEGVS